MSEETRSDVEVVISLSPWVLFLLLVLWGFVIQFLERRQAARESRSARDGE